MKMGHCKIVAVAFIVMMESCSMAPVMACHYCPPALNPPPKTPTVPTTPVPPPKTPTVPTTPVPPTVPTTPVPPPKTPTVPTIPVPPTVPTTPVPPSSPPSSETCPLDALKLGACADVLGGLLNISLGDPSVNKCCPVLQGILEIEAALCLCTTIKLKLLNLNIALPLALQLLLTCGINTPPGFTCPTV